jgi:hypothetical protein
MEELGAGLARGWCVFEPSALFPGRLPEAFEFFCDYTFEVSRRLGGRKLFACDELQRLVGTMFLSDRLAAVLETGRVYGLDAAMIGIAPNLLHNRIRNQVTEVVTFQHMDPAAMSFLEAFGFDPGQVRALPRGAFIARNDAGGQTAGRLF